MNRENLKMINLVTDSIVLWERYMRGEITREQYQKLQEQKLKQIRRIRNGKTKKVK